MAILEATSPPRAHHDSAGFASLLAVAACCTLLLASTPAGAFAQAMGAAEARAAGLHLSTTPLDALQLPVGGTFQIRAYYDGARRDARPRQVSYQVKHGSIVRVSSNGFLTAVAVGETTVTVTDGAQSVRIRVVVVKR